jgi:hypothetical protein
MEQNNTNSEKIVSKEELFDENGRFKVGHPKVGGKEKGTRDFATDWDEVVDEIAEENGITKSQARKHLLKVAYKQAKDGNFNFFKDVHDRVYGQAKQRGEVEHSGSVLVLPSELINKNDTSSNTESSSK